MNCDRCGLLIIGSQAARPPREVNLCFTCKYASRGPISLKNLVMSPEDCRTALENLDFSKVEEMYAATLAQGDDAHSEFKSDLYRKLFGRDDKPLRFCPVCQSRVETYHEGDYRSRGAFYCVDCDTPVEFYGRLSSSESNLRSPA